MTPRTRPATSPTCLTADNHETRRTTMESRNRVQITAATALVNAGCSLQALMALLGHVSAEMSLRYGNSQELHQPGEKLQVSSSQHRRNGVPLVLMPAL
jgi:hypothetical protein